jgi:hypothetical protein
MTSIAGIERIDKYAFFKNIGYRPHAGQDLFHASQARFRLANCGRRFGKSTMSARDEEPKLFGMKNRLTWIVGPTYDLGEKEFRVIWNDIIVKARMGTKKGVKRSYNKKQGVMFIEFPWGSRVEVRSAQHPENLVGDGLHHAIMSEAAKHNPDTWSRFIQPALADFRGTADFPTTPEGYNWLYDLWMLGQNPDIPEYESWIFPSWSNVHLFPNGKDEDEIKLLQKTMPPEAFLQEIGAEFGSFVGKIYPEWDLTRHVEKVNFNPMWRNYIAFDWGYTNPLAAIEFQISPSDEIYIWREHYKSFTRVEDHCKELKQREQPAGYHLDLAFGDAADPEAAVTVSQKLVPCIAMPEAKENWRDGIDLVRSFMEREDGEDEFGGPIYKPALHVDHSCVNTIKEFNNYKSKESPKGMNVPEMGQKMADHAMDAIRYGLVHVFTLGATYHLADVMELNSDRANSNKSLVGAAGISLAASDTGYFTNTGNFEGVRF